jgi:hypothetical protein
VKRPTAKTWGKGGVRTPTRTCATCTRGPARPAPVIRAPIRINSRPCYGKGGKGGSCTQVPNLNINTFTPAPAPCGSYGCSRPTVLPPLGQNNLRPPPRGQLPFPPAGGNSLRPPPPRRFPPLPPSGANNISPPPPSIVDPGETFLSPPPPPLGAAPPPGPCASEYVCLPAASFSSQSVPLGKTVWMTAVFTHSRMTNFNVVFSNVSVTLRPKPGFVGYTRTVGGKPFYVQMTSGPVLCSAVTWSSSRSAYVVSSSTSNTGTVLLAAHSFSAPTDLANHEAIM